MEVYPLGMSIHSYGKWASRKFVSFPMNSMVIFHSYVRQYQRVDASVKQTWKTWANLENVGNMSPMENMATGPDKVLNLLIPEVLAKKLLGSIGIGK